MLVHPEGWSLAHQVDRVISALEPGVAAHVTTETHMSALELASGVHQTAGGAGAELTALRRGLDDGIAPLGLLRRRLGHPPVRGLARHRGLDGRPPAAGLRLDARAGPPRADLRPARPRRDRRPRAARSSWPTGCGATSRCCSRCRPTRRSGRAATPVWPRRARRSSRRSRASGIPRAFGSYAEYVEAVDVLVRSGAFPEPTFLWWDVRPQPRLGTIEIRVDGRAGDVRGHRGARRARAVPRPARGRGGLRRRRALLGPARGARGEPLPGRPRRCRGRARRPRRGGARPRAHGSLPAAPGARPARRGARLRVRSSPASRRWPSTRRPAASATSRASRAACPAWSSGWPRTSRRTRLCRRRGCYGEGCSRPRCAAADPERTMGRCSTSPPPSPRPADRSPRAWRRSSSSTWPRFRCRRTRIPSRGPCGATGCSVAGSASCRSPRLATSTGRGRGSRSCDRTAAVTSRSAPWRSARRPDSPGVRSAARRPSTPSRPGTSWRRPTPRCGRRRASWLPGSRAPSRRSSSPGTPRRRWPTSSGRRRTRDRGLEGDRYFDGRGTFSNWPRPRARPHAGRGRGARRARDLDRGGSAKRRHPRDRPQRAGRAERFRIGEVACLGQRLCEPCAHLERLAGRPGILRALVHRGGLRADVVSDGAIGVGDAVVAR